jgi:hypothetical protein
MDAGRDFLFQGRKPFLIAGGRVEMQLWSYGYCLPPRFMNLIQFLNIRGVSELMAMRMVKMAEVLMVGENVRD